MILQSLVKYYETLEAAGKVTKPGWCRAKVSFALDIAEDGKLLGVIPLKIEEERGKKTVLVPQLLKVPEMISRSSGVSANFLCDNSSYILGIDNKGKPQRSKECFACAAKKHLDILEETDTISARAVKNFFSSWNPEEASAYPVLMDNLEEILTGGNLIFTVNGEYVQDDSEIKDTWDKWYNQKKDVELQTCMVTGEKAEIARTHGLIKGVPGAQSSGAALISFNAPAFESFGKEQSYNAPVGIYAVYAYTTALNYLLADKKHSSIIGDTIIVYWSEDGEEKYQNVFAQISEPTVDNQEVVDGVFKNLEQGRAVVVEDVEKSLSADQPFYILGLSPNAARIAVRFFYQDSFGNILRNIKAHYDRMKIVRPASDSMEYLGIWRVLQETVNKKSREKKPAPNMAGSLYRAVISGGRYPMALYQAVLGRIRAEQDDSDNRSYKITRGRASIIKAYLLRNTNESEEDITMALNESNTNPAYILGRMFAVLEAIQEEANPGINATIKDRYFNSASATPASIFPILFKLGNSHIKKIGKPGTKVYFEKLLGELQEKISITADQTEAYPRRLTLEEQGLFILGYYHQTQKRYEKKAKEEKENG